MCLQVAVPVDRRLIGYIVANIGEFARTHGMTVREAGNYLNRYYLKPGDKPQASFYVPNQPGLVAREYCNIHGLWKK